jgi:double-stranded uracil-DNA glycosylase
MPEPRHSRVPDVIAPDLRVLFCGINPGLYSAQVRRHFARPGNRFWKALHLAGFTEERLAPNEQEALIARGCGITNLVARETASAVQLSGEELRAGGRGLERKVRRYRPAWLAILGVTAYRAAFDEPRAQVGPQERRLAGAEVWVLPNPSGLNAHYQVADLARHFRELRQAAGLVDRSRRARATSRAGPGCAVAGGAPGGADGADRTKEARDDSR